ncbi:MAG TPA: EB domain-containing protein, partial [bacterium]|nr:EB domain-containing protein [bacterium]
MNLSSFRFFTVALMFVLAVVLSGCSGKKTCSADTQCKDGSYCNDGKCTEFKEGDYKIVFESPSDKATITSAQDLDLSVEGIQIDVKVAMEDEQNYINDGMSVTLSIKKGENEVLLTGKFLKNKAVFSQITLPEGEVTLSAYLEQNPGVKTTVTVNSVKMDVTMYYLKGGAEGTKTLLESSIITDED